MADIIQTHRITNQVSTSNPVLADGELAYNEVSKDLRIGDDATAYNSLDRIDMAGAVLPWKSILTFAASEVVVYSGGLYKSLQGSNLNKTPSSEPTWWEAIGSGSFSSPLTTKGDLLAFSTADARLPVGTDGQVLAADSTETLGVKWTAAGSGGGGHTIQDDGVDQTQRTNLDFVGFDISDDSGNDATKIELPAASQVHKAMVMIDSVDITSAVTSHVFTGLDGDADLDYKIVAVINTAATSEFYVQPNGDTTASNYRRRFSANGGNGTNQSHAGFEAGTTTAGKITPIEVSISAKTGLNRTSFVNSGTSIDATAIAETYHAANVWYNTVDNITSLSFIGTGASGIGVGSRIELWALREVGGGGASASAPASASATGTAGTLAYDTGYLYVCTATDTWKRTALSTWS